MKPISFRDNVAGRHGDVLRSSAIFYVRENETTRSTVSFMNYWKFKRGLDVAVIASTRSMAGELLHRERLTFDLGDVINYRAPVQGVFEGSVEIEVFATQNMVIPYSAIVCIYETKTGYSVVHGYARTYSNHEIEDGRTLSLGREACWTIRDDVRTHSMAVVHNGSRQFGAQRVRLCVTNHLGEKAQTFFDWPELGAFESRLIRPAEHIPGLVDHLQGKPGHAGFDFELGAGFTRMLIGNERIDGSDWQVTHSNFDYSRQPTDLAELGEFGYMAVPNCGGLAKRVLIYGQSHPGTYRAQVAGTDGVSFRSGDNRWLTDVAGSTVRFEGVGQPLATRLVTAIEMSAPGDALPGECSLGMLTRLQPKKRMWWGTVAAPTSAETSLVVHDLPEIYGGAPPDAVLELALYSAKNQVALKASIPFSRLFEFEQGVPLATIWPQAIQHLDGEAGYYTLFCEYGGLSAYSLMTNQHASVCLEHGF